MNFAYAYDDRGNITSETRNGLITNYTYDALGQLVQVDDPHEQATWKYCYDRGGNITKKEQYTWPAGATSAPSSLGDPTKTIHYGYDDPNWKDKLTSYDGKTITYDAIGNPLNDGVRTYTWGAGRQLRHISMLTGEEHGFRASNGVHEGSNTLLRIVHDEADSKLKVKLLRNGRDVTDECAASAFAWTKAGSAAGTGKEIAVTEAEVNGDVQFSCTYTETQGVYGTVSVDNNLVASHDPATADATHVFTLENGMLKVEIPNSAGNGTDYKLVDGVLSVNPGFTGTITAEYEFTTNPTREIDFEYDHNGLRTQKKVVENGITTIYDYILHGKLITHLTKRVVDLEGVETSEELHFFYDAQSKPVFMECDGTVYHYIHNLQGDIVAIVDSSGTCVVEYRYDVWGIAVSEFVATAIGLDEINPFRYRGYVWDKDAELYYLRTRYYDAEYGRFVSPDTIAEKHTSTLASEKNLYTYCYNDANDYADEDGAAGFLASLVGGALIGGIVNVATTIISHVAKPNKEKDDKLCFRDIAVSFVSGAVSGAFSVIPGFSGRLLGSAISAMVEGAGYYFECVEEGKAYEWQEVAMRYSYNFATGMLNPVIPTEYGTKILKGTVGEVVSYGYDQFTSDIGRYYEDLREANNPPATRPKGWFETKRVYDPLMGEYRYVRIYS